MVRPRARVSLWFFACAWLPSIVACAGGRVVTAADGVLERHLASRGGEAALRALEVVERVGTLTTFDESGEVRGRYRTCLQYGEAGVIDIDAGTIQVHEVVRRQGAVRCNEHFLDCRPIVDPDALRVLVATTHEANRELLYERTRWADAPRVERTGASVLVMAREEGGGEVQYVFSEPAGLLSTKSRETKEGLQRRHYLGWQKTESVAFPRILEHYLGERLLYRVEISTVRLASSPSPWCVAILDRAVRHLD